MSMKKSEKSLLREAKWAYLFSEVRGLNIGVTWDSLQDEQSSKNSNVSLLTYEKAEQRHAKKGREVIKCRDYKLSFSMSLKYL